MYIRFPHPAYISRSLVKDVRFFSVERTDAPDDEGGDFYAICDASVEPDESMKELAYFNSPQAALKVFHEICVALDVGKQYFDLYSRAVKIGVSCFATLMSGGTQTAKCQILPTTSITAYDENGNLE